MTDEEPLLAAASASPPGDPARLVYADWLDERADPRGGLVRVMERMHAPAPSGEAFAALRPRRNALRAAADPAWVARMGYQPTHRPLFGTLPPTRAERWRLVEEFIDVWHGPLQPGDGHTEDEIAEAERRLGVRLPAALREWYALAGKRPDVWSQQDRLHSLEQVRTDEHRGVSLVRTENNAVAVWGVRANHLPCDDPQVVCVVEDGGEFSLPSTTGFAIQALLSEAAFAQFAQQATSSRGGVYAIGWVDEAEIAAELARQLCRCDTPDGFWAGGYVHFWEGADVIVQCFDLEHHVQVAARTEEAFARLSEEFRARLERP